MPMNKREGFGRQNRLYSVLNLHKVFNYEKPEDPSRIVLRRKASETFAPCPPSRDPQLSKRKNNKPLICSKNAQFFVEACEKFNKYSWRSNNYSYI